MKVMLKGNEVFSAALVGVRRTIGGFKRDKSKEQDPNWSWSNDIEGAAAEVVVAKALNIYFDGFPGRFKDPDVGEYQVRQTNLNHGKLIVRNDDASDEIFILVTGKCPEFTIRGYMLGGDAKKDEYWQNPNQKTGAWFVPQDKLLPIADLEKNKG